MKFKNIIENKPVNKLYFALLVYFNGIFGKRFYYPTAYYLITVFEILEVTLSHSLLPKLKTVLLYKMIACLGNTKYYLIIFRGSTTLCPFNLM